MDHPAVTGASVGLVSVGSAPGGVGFVTVVTVAMRVLLHGASVGGCLGSSFLNWR